MPYLALVLILCSNSFAQLSDILFKECNLERVRELKKHERVDLVNTIKNLFTSQPTPPVDPLQGLVLSSLSEKAINCAKKLIPELVPESYTLIPNIIGIITDDTQSFDSQVSFKKLLKSLLPINSLPPDVVDRLIDQLETRGSLPALLLEPIAPINQLVRAYFGNPGDRILDLINRLDPQCQNRFIDESKPKKVNLKLFEGCPHLNRPDYFVSLTYDPTFTIRYQASEILSGYPLEPELLIQLITLSSNDVWHFILEKSVCSSSFAVGNYLLSQNAQNFSPEILSRFICLASSEDQSLLERLINDTKSPDFLREAALKRYISVGKPPFNKFIGVGLQLSDEIASMLYERTGDKRLKSKALSFMRNATSGEFSRLSASLTKAEISAELTRGNRFLANLNKIKFPELVNLKSERDVYTFSKFKDELLPYFKRSKNQYALLFRTLFGGECLSGLPEVSCPTMAKIADNCSNSSLRQSILESGCLHFDKIYQFAPLQEKELALFNKPAFIPLRLIPKEKRVELFARRLNELTSSEKVQTLLSIEDKSVFKDVALELFRTETDPSVKLALLRFIEPSESEYPFLLESIKADHLLIPCLYPHVQSASIIRLLRDNMISDSMAEQLGQLVHPTSELKVALYDFYQNSKVPAQRYKIAASLYVLYPDLREEILSEYQFDRFTREFQQIIQRGKISCPPTVK